MAWPCAQARLRYRAWLQQSKHEGNEFITAPGIGRVIAGVGMGWAAQASRTQGSLGSSRVPGQHAVPVFCLSELNILILRVVRGCWISPRLGRVSPLKVVFSALTSVYGCLFWDEMS